MRFFCALIMAGWAFTTQSAMALEIACPETLSVTPQMELTPAGWRAHDDTVNSPVQAEGISVYDGAVEDLAMLVPDNADSGDTFDVWTIYPSPRGNWVECRYTHTSLTLSQRLPDTVKSCRVERVTDGSGPPPVIRCE